MAILLVSLEVPAGRKAGLPDNFGMTGPQFWRFQFGTGQWINASADSDGDGRADLIAVGTSGSNVIEIARTSPQGKPLPGLNAWPSIGAGVVAAVSGKFFSGETSASVLAILAILRQARILIRSWLMRSKSLPSLRFGITRY